MGWRVELAETASRQLAKLDRPNRDRILNFLGKRLAVLPDPRQLGQALHGSELGEFWRYRVGDYRVVCRLQDERLTVLVLQVGHRREIYR